jgi:hypothetical protein
VTAQARQVADDAKVAAAKVQAKADAHALSTSIKCELKTKKVTPVPTEDTPPLPLPTALYDLTCRNAGGADVHGFKGAAILKGPFGEWIDALPIRHDELLAANGIFEEKISRPFVSMGDGMNALAFHNLPVEKISVQVQLDSLVLADGRLINSDSF